jgi:hypothetical protein
MGKRIVANDETRVRFPYPASASVAQWYSVHVSKTCDLGSTPSGGASVSSVYMVRTLVFQSGETGSIPVRGIYSAIAQRQSNRLLTDGLQVQILLAESI